jgi:6-phosphogluconate dehydrogenase
MKTLEYEIGRVGLGVMGRQLALNTADHGLAMAGYERMNGQGTFHTDWEPA